MTSRIPSAETVLRVVSIQRFSLQDGPGIRTTVFLQGCPLHCPWCANPESRPLHPVQRHSVGKCSRCLRCAAVCPEGCIQPGPDGFPSFDRKSCIGCGTCEKTCPGGAISVSGKPMTVKEIMETVGRDTDYYRNSGGGVTFSGGEPLLQPEGLMDLLEAAKDQGIDTAIETCGNVPTERILQAAPLTGLFLFDVKHADPVVLKKVTGGDADLIFRNLAALSGTGRKVIARVPCIPGFNLEENVLRDIYTRIAACGIGTVRLLPYHTYGVDKYRELSLPYTFPRKGIGNEDLEAFAQMGRRMGLDVQPW